MGDYHYCRTELAVNLMKDAGDGPTVCRVQVAGRFVSQQYARAIDDGSADGDSLGLPARQFARQGVDLLVESDGVESLASLISGLIVGLSGKHRRHHDIIDDREEWLEVKRLKNEADAGAAQLTQLVVIESGDVLPIDVDLTG